MPYCIIRGEPVFLTRAREGELRGKFFPNLEDRIGSLIQGHPEAGTFQRKCVEDLERRHDADPESFRRDWVSFDLQGDDAGEHLWDLLYDYCHLHQHGRLVDLRDDTTRALADLLHGDAWLFPMGRVFAFVEGTRVGWWRRRAGGPSVRIVFAADLVKRIVGTLQDFTVQQGRWRLRFAQDVEVVPWPVGDDHM